MIGIRKVGAEDKVLIVEIVDIVRKVTGNMLGDKEASMIEARLTRRFTELGLASIKAYHSFFRENQAKELDYLVGLLTTHHTYFFREFSHFEFVVENLPNIIENVKAKGKNTINIWCSACSTGQEVYSFAMYILNYLEENMINLKLNLFGSDIDSQSVKIAENAVYPWADSAKIPMVMLSKYMVRGKNKANHFMKVSSKVRALCNFGRINLTKAEEFPIGAEFDLIICRNIFIYFKAEDIKKITTNLLSRLANHGFLIIGLSETLLNLNLDVTHIGKSIYKSGKSAESVAVPPQYQPTVAQVPRAVSTPASAPAMHNNSDVTKGIPVHNGPIRVLCVDDSPTVIKVLKKIFSDSSQFEVVGVAENGVEAAKLAKELEFDVMTLDIHMPEMDGITYLKNYMNDSHPPVVMVSSVSRENIDVAVKSLEYGASDYVEKPSLQNMQNVKEEITSKVKFASRAFRKKGDIDLSLIKEFSKTEIITGADKKATVLVANVGQIEKVTSIVKHLGKPQPPLLIYVDCKDELLESMQKALTSHGVESRPGSEATEFFSGRVYLFNKLPPIESTISGKESNLILLAELDKKCLHFLNAFKGRVVVEEGLELEYSGSNVVEVAFSSIAYESDKLHVKGIAA